MPLFYRADTVEAHLLTWDNWQQITELVHGRFQQTMTLERSTGRTEGVAYLMIPKYIEPGERRVEIGWWVVKEGDEWIGMPPDMFQRMYRPANVLTR